MFFRELTARVPVKAAVMGRTAPWSAPATTSSTARPSTAPASAKRVHFYFYPRCRPLVVAFIMTPPAPPCDQLKRGCCVHLQGWRGAKCSSPCSEGTWGRGCNATCRCTNGAKCDLADGSCSCTAGWHGTHCEQPCPVNTCT